MSGKNKHQQVKKRKKSLSKSIQRLVLTVALVIFLAASILNAIAANTEISTMFDVSSQHVLGSMRTVISLFDHFDDYANDIIGTYEGLTDAERENPFDGAYLSHFSGYESGAYCQDVSAALDSLQTSLTTGDLYIAALNPETGVLLSLIDPEGELIIDHNPAGTWKQLTKEQASIMLQGKTKSDYFENNSKDYGRTRVYGLQIMPAESPWVICSVNEMPLLLSRVLAVLFIVIYIIVLTFLILLILIVTRLKIRKRLVKPIRSIASAAGQFAENRNHSHAESAPQTEKLFFQDLDIHTGDELEELGMVMAQMEQDIGIYERNLSDAAAQQAQIHTELSVATDIQAHMLPDPKSAFPDHPEFSLYASMHPAREVGGDFYDFFLIDENHLGIVIADVSDKGIPAALFMMSSMIMINNYATLGFTPKEVLEKANARICSSNAMSMFVTVWFGILDLKTGEVKAANAGHEYPVVSTDGSEFRLLHDRHDLVIGAMDGVRYSEYSFTLQKGGALYVYTDGVAEASNEQNEMYGTERLLRVLNDSKDLPVEQICSKITGDIRRFVLSAPQFDDITMVCLRYNGQA